MLILVVLPGRGIYIYKFEMTLLQNVETFKLVGAPMGSPCL
jgi:hypothetical protein